MRPDSNDGMRDLLSGGYSLRQGQRRRSSSIHAAGALKCTEDNQDSS